MLSHALGICYHLARDMLLHDKYDSVFVVSVILSFICMSITLFPEWIVSHKAWSDMYYMNRALTTILQLHLVCVQFQNSYACTLVYSTSFLDGFWWASHVSSAMVYLMNHKLWQTVKFLGLHNTSAMQWYIILFLLMTNEWWLMSELGWSLFLLAVLNYLH